MTTIRQKRVAESYFHVLRQILCFENPDGDLNGVVITQVVLTPDLRLAKIYFSLDDAKQDHKKTLEVLERNARFFRKRLGQEVSLKFSPELKFYHDESEVARQNMDALFRQIEDERHGQSQKD